MAPVVLPSNWLYDEFHFSQTPGNEARGTELKYTCKCCPSETFTGTRATRRHAVTKTHRKKVDQRRLESPSPERAPSPSFNLSDGVRRSFQAPSPPLQPVGRLDQDIDMLVDDFHFDAQTLESNHDPDTMERPDFEDDGDRYPDPCDLPWSDIDSGGESDSESSATDCDEAQEHSDLDGEGEGSDGGGDTATGASRRSKQAGCRPYPNMTWCILDTMLNLPRHPLSDEQLRILLWGLKLLRVKHVPSFSQLRQFQTRLRQAPTFRKDISSVSVLGNHFTTNSILKSIALDMGNREVRKHLFFYPEEPGANGASELRHSWKWLAGLPDDQLTPMWEKGDVHFYVGEISALDNGELVIPLRWFLREGLMHMVYYPVHLSTAGTLIVDDSERRKMAASRLAVNLPNLIARGGHEQWVGCTVASTKLQRSPLVLNPWRVRAQGRPCYRYFILLGGDDVSGNRSKSWNKHWCFYYCAAGLPLACMNQEYFIHFVSTSQHAGPVEQVAAITAEIRSVRESGYICREALEGRGSRECLVVPGIFVETGDGPWQSELSSHSGDSKPCRFCEVGGTVKERSSDDGFLAIMEPGMARTPDKTRMQIEADLALATQPRKGTEIEKNQQKTGTCDTLAQSLISDLVERGKTMFNEKDANGNRVHSNADIRRTLEEHKAEQLHKGEFINSLLSDDVFNPHLDTAVGRLHLVLLGFTKYFWSASLPAGGGQKLSIKEKEILAAAEATLFALDQSGLGDRSVRPEYVMHFRGSLVGRHLHSITQLAVFIFARIVEPILRHVWITLSRLCAMLFIQAIKDMESFAEDLQVVVDDFYDAVCQYNPTWVMYKNKFHYLAHTLQMILRFGVLGLVAEDRFEKFHGLWRQSSIYSNHHAASRDSAQHFNSLDATKHILAGGLFEWEGEVIQAGADVLEVFASNTHLRNRLGLHTRKARVAGHVVCSSRAPSLTWESVAGALDAGLESIWPATQRSPRETFYQEAKSFVTVRGDISKPGSFAWTTAPQPGIVRILGIYSRSNLSRSQTGAPSVIIRVKLYSFGERHDVYDCPCLTKTSTYLLEPSDILFLVNVQHDCILGNCQVSHTLPEQQERTLTERIIPVINHSDDEHFVLNVFVLHHYDELIERLPWHLVGPSSCRHPQERKRIRTAAAVVLRQQNDVRNATRGAVRAARSEATSRAATLRSNAGEQNTGERGNEIENQGGAEERPLGMERAGGSRLAARPTRLDADLQPKRRGTDVEPGPSRASKHARMQEGPQTLTTI